MKKTLLALLPALLCMGSAQSSVLATEDFDYPDSSSLTDNAAWSNHSGTVGDLLISGGWAVLQHGVPSEDANISLGAPITTGTIFFSFDFSVPDIGAAIGSSGTDFEYFAHLKDSGTDFTSRVDIVAPSGSGDFSVGIGDGSIASAIWGTDLSYDTTYGLTVGFDFSTGVSTLWIDASSDTDPSIASAPATVPDMEAFALRQSDSSANEAVLVDNLIVATTFAETIPEPTTSLLGALSLVALLRRRR